MLATRALGKAYTPGRWALRGLGIEVPNGSLVMLLGANGAGKSTTINCFLDFIRPTEGAALVDDTVVAGAPLEAKRRLAYLGETLAVYPSLTGAQNLRFFVGLGGARAPGRHVAIELLQRMGLAREAADRPVREYSKGMRQKLGLAIAMARGTTNVILDEPTTGLDPATARELIALLAELRATGAAILTSTHDVYRASDCADRVYILRDGRLVADLSRSELGTLDLEREYLRLMGER